MRKTIQTRIKEYRNYLIYKINHSNENLKDHDTATLIARKQEDEVWIKSGYEQLLGVRCASEVIYEDFENIFKNPKNTNPLENLLDYIAHLEYLLNSPLPYPSEITTGMYRGTIRNSLRVLYKKFPETKPPTQPPPSPSSPQQQSPSP